MWREYGVDSGTNSPIHIKFLKAQVGFAFYYFQRLNLTGEEVQTWIPKSEKWYDVGHGCHSLIGLEQLTVQHRAKVKYYVWTMT